ncbi:MAG: peptidase M48 [Candidatus Yanofskybacteria bacterium CG10_big_fil_rev_8_21_14_0_10_36_16]|uniref:Peptidase M48 n=1 Tax=Candidatus Yanofskybacteria bacterium CG10_big_fil_rev_8_21_14_0_10_36_16 TaxID=1975096 RepID=A0A2J0Q744_9BACT|nr:MAG: peptidase M48 [Candidatus Yanofskybacteria bacterium CG10_big_fil_rev_8_21_14_0_10_36_16]
MAHFVLICLFLCSCAAKDNAGSTDVPPAPSNSNKETQKSDLDNVQKNKVSISCKGEYFNFDEIGARDVGQGLNFYSIEKEIALGSQMAKEVEEYAKIIDDPVISEYVNRVGQNLVRNSDAKVPFTIKMIDSPEINAFALPGGFFFINSGLVLNVDNESEMASVMAHEIAHVTSRHGVKQATRGQIANLASIPLMIMTGGGWAGYAIYQGASLAIPMTFLKFSRNFETEADWLGLQYLWATGYDPSSMVDVFEKLAALEKRKKGTLAKVFSSHPPNSKRAGTIQDLMQCLPNKDQYVLNTAEFRSVKDRLVTLNEEFRRKDKEYDDSRPKLRRKNDDVIEPESKDGGEKEEDKPPVLKRPDKFHYIN